LLGSLDPDAPAACGGKLEFHDATTANYHPPPAWREADSRPEPASQDQVEADLRPPFWDAVRRTGVATCVALDRRTRTADTHKLFHLEFVPPGAVFAITVTGQNLDDDEVSATLRLLQELKATAVGAGTANGWGRGTWHLTDLQCLDAKEVQRWLAGGSEQTGDAILRSLSPEDREKRRQAAARHPLFTPGPGRLALEVELTFDSPFLTNDPHKAGKVSDHRYGHHVLRNADGEVLLPATSVHGVFRSQAERILRTIVAAQGGAPEKVVPPPGKVVVREDTELARKLPTIDRVFGGVGWRSPVEFGDFKGRFDRFVHDFVAIDRFTGGAAGGAKFNAFAALNPTLTGTITIDLDRLRRVEALDHAIGLIALVFRDLFEGDLTFGFGAAKGYGSCTGRIVSYAGLDSPADLQLPAATPTSASAPSLTAEVKARLQSAVDGLRQRPDLRATPRSQ
jgi:CRISPR/Cas system CSM-associated protein Csm3 (group 7 of RAMP superfamily)